MNILALDLGSKTGFALSVCRPNGERFETSGTIFLATEKQMKAERDAGRDRTGDIRVIRLGQALTKLLSGIEVDLVVFEDVLFSASRAQTQLWASLRAAVWIACSQENLALRPARLAVPTGTLKKFASGHGGADKAMMERAFQKWFAGRDSVDDNERDAVFLLEYGKQHFKTKD